MCLVTQSCPTLHNPMDWPTRLLQPWDSPGKNTGVGGHALLHLKPYNMVNQLHFNLKINLKIGKRSEQILYQRKYRDRNKHVGKC